MDKEKFLLRLSLEIDTLKAHVNRLKPAGYKIHPLDMELLRKKAMDLYDLMLQFEMDPNKVADIQDKPVVVPEKRPETEPVVESPKEPRVEATPPPAKPAVPVITEVEQPLAEDVTLDQESQTADTPVMEIPEEPKAETPVEPIAEKPMVAPQEPPTEVETKVNPIEKPAPIREEKPVEEKPATPRQEDFVSPPPPKAHPPKPAPVKTTLDLFSTVPESLGSRTMAESDNSVAGRIQKERLQNIRSAIGINEKFLFLNELFKGDLARYNRVIDELNAMQTKQGADTYLMELKIEGQFGENHPAFEKLKEIVARKY